jgi:16S rRNA (guanine527-N7)-methyltransferase
MQFKESILAHQRAFGLTLDESAIEKLSAFYDLVEQHNPILHLVAPCSVDEFVIRHILESLMLLEHLPENVSFADIGTGAGLPSIPCLIVRPDLRGVLIESKPKKCAFLEEAIETLGIAGRATIIDRQFEEIQAPAVDFVTSRALDKFSEKLPKLIRWAGGRPLRLFGGPKIESELIKNRIKFKARLLPMSEQRYLFVGENASHRIETTK